MFGEITVEDRTAKKKIISVLTAVAITVAATVVLALIGIKIQSVKEPEIIAKVVTKTEEVRPKMKKVNVQKMAKQASTSSSSAMATRMVRANTSAVIAMPKVTKVNNGVLGLGEGDFGDGFGSGNGMGAGGVGSMKGVGRRIGGMTVKADRLGVVLDVSGSMTDHLEKLKKEIKKEFKDAVFREVTGCRLDTNAGNIEELDPKNPRRRSVLEAMRELAEVEKVDAVFWFCDLNDGESEEGLEALKMSFWHGKPPVMKKEEKSEFGGLDELKRMQDRSKMKEEAVQEPCRLYIRSVGKKPEKPLMEVIKASGGSFKKA